jgi:hypothetical protein
MIGAWPKCSATRYDRGELAARCTAARYRPDQVMKQIVRRGVTALAKALGECRRSLPAS